MAYLSTPEMEQLIKQVQVLDLGKVCLHEFVNALYSVQSLHIRSYFSPRW